jgi:hypothetical protein
MPMQNVDITPLTIPILSEFTNKQRSSLASIMLF